MDNHSTDGTVDMVREIYPAAIVLPLEQNIGIDGWNKGFEIAKGEFFLVLDDDSYPDHNALTVGIARLLQDPECGVLALQVYNLHTQRMQTSSLVQGNNTTFIGCGAILRADVVKKAGMFEEILFLYMHEDEFAMRAIDAGYTVKYEHAAVVRHINSPVHRGIRESSGIDARRQFYLVKNILTILVLHFSFLHLVFRIPRIILGRVVFGLRYRCLGPVLRGIASFFWNFRIISLKRTVLTEQTQKLYRFGSFAGGFFFNDKVRDSAIPRKI